MSGLENQVGLALPWLVGLRWAAMVSQALLILLLVFFYDIPVPPVLVSVIFGFSWLSNMYLHSRQDTENTVTNGLVTSILALDTIMLTLLIFATGGAMNPFTFLYLIEVALAAIILPQTGAWIVTVISILCYGALFLPGVQSIGGLTNHPPACHAQNDVTGAMRLHLQGMWVAYSISAVCVVFILGKIQKALSVHRDTALSLHDEKMRSDMLASLATLAAGAAHELSTPLSTIAVASSEMIETLKEAESELLDDAVLIRNQVRGCKDILFQMAADAGEHRGEANHSFLITEAVSGILESIDPAQRDRVQVSNTTADVIYRMPLRTLCRSVAGLVNNGLEADSEGGFVKVTWLCEGEDLVIKVTDTGKGMDEETLQQATEPFFTTRSNGLGLGLFLASSMADRFDGSLEIISQPGQGTTTTLRMSMARIS